MADSPALLVIGEALVDIVGGESHPGGSPANVALTLGRLGGSPRLLSHLAADDAGESIRAWLGASGVELDARSLGAARTPSARVSLDEDGAAQYDFDLSWALPDPVDEHVDHIHLGSIAAIDPAASAALHELLRRNRGRASISYDPNARPALIDDLGAARRRVEALVAVSDLVKASDEDLATLYPGDDPDARAAAWLRSGPAIVAVTRGGSGATAFSATGRVDVGAPTVEVVDTVGAGDTVIGALIDGLARAGLLGRSRHDALRAIAPAALRALLDRAVRAAAITVSRAGADPPTAADLTPRE